MCLIIFNWEPESLRPLTLAANRDEFHSRTSLDAHFWADYPRIFAGRDLEKNGTWLGLAKNNNNRSFRLAALTNFRSVDRKSYEHSRGEITQQFLTSDLNALEYVQQISFCLYAGFNALFFDGNELVYCHHEADSAPVYYALDKGVYGLSNAELDTPWPKVEKTKMAFHTLENNASHIASANHLFVHLRNDTLAEDKQLPSTGVSIEVERMLSAAFIISPNYGTRTATVVIIDSIDGKQSVFFDERQFSNKGDNSREVIKRLA